MRAMPWPAILLIASAPAPHTSPQTLHSDDIQTRLATVPQLNVTPRKLDIDLPQGQELGMVSWLDRDPRTGLLWLLQRGPSAEPILAVDPATGHIAHAFGRGSFTIPHALRIAPDGTVWTVDAGSSQVIHWSPAGNKLLTLQIPAPHPATSGFGGPTDIAFTPAGHILIADGYTNARILEYTTTGQLVRQWGSPGAAPGQFHLPHALIFDTKGSLYIADRQNGRIQKFDATGKPLAEFTNLGRVYDLTPGPHQTLWVSTSAMNTPPGSPGWILQLDRNTGKILGYIPVQGNGVLHTLTTDSNGNPLTGVGSAVFRFATPTPQPAR